MNEHISIYLTHNNGARPFKVCIDSSNNTVNVFTNDDINLRVYTNIYSKIYIGKSPKNDMTEYSGGFGDNYDGNSILVKLQNNEYVFIGDEIYSFYSPNNIDSFVSPVGNNDVPYPYAIDSCGNYYLFIENVILTRNDINTQLFYLHDDNPYQIYYALDLITADKAYSTPKLPIISNFQDISRYYIGRNEYTLRYTPYPNLNYDRHIKRNSRSQMYIIDTDGTKRLFSREKYMFLMHQFGLKAGFTPIYKQTIVK